MAETKFTSVKSLKGGNFTVELSQTDNGALFLSIARSFFYKAKGKMINQEIKFPANQIEELEYMTGELKAERDKVAVNGNGHKEGA